MKHKGMKRSALMLALAMCLTSFAFPLNSSADEKKTGKIVFEKAEIKEFTLTDKFKSVASIPASVTKAEFAKIDDRVPFYVALAETQFDNTGKCTPLDLKADGSGNVYSDAIVYDPDNFLNCGWYRLIAVDENLNLKEAYLKCYGVTQSAVLFNSLNHCLSSMDFESAGGTVIFSPVDRGENGKIEWRYNTKYSPFDKVYYKTSPNEEYKAWPVDKGELGLLDVPGYYFGFKFTLNDHYKLSENFFDFCIGGINSTCLPLDDDKGEYSFEINNITHLSPEMFDSNELKDYGYFIDISAEPSYFGDLTTGVSIGESKTGNASFEEKDGYCEVTIEDLNVEKGHLNISGLEQGVTPYKLIVKGTNKVEDLIFDCPVEVICEKGASLSYKNFNVLDPNNYVPGYVLGDDTVLDKDSGMFKSTKAAPTPTATNTPVPTATATPVPTVTATPVPTDASEPTATPTAIPATATPTVTDPTLTPTATPTTAVTTEEPTPAEPTVIAQQEDITFTYKNLVYKIENGKTATLTGADKNLKKITVPASVKYNGKTYKVTKIANNAINGSKAKTVSLGKNITSIDAGAINNCKKLTTLNINSNIKKLDAGIIKKCKKLKIVKIKSKKLSSVDKKAFSGCKVKILKVYINKKVFKKISPKIMKIGIKKSNILKL